MAYLTQELERMAGPLGIDERGMRKMYITVRHLNQFLQTQKEKETEECENDYDNRDEAFEDYER